MSRKVLHSGVRRTFEDTFFIAGREKKRNGVMRRFQDGLLHIWIVEFGSRVSRIHYSAEISSMTDIEALKSRSVMANGRNRFFAKLALL